MSKVFLSALLICLFIGGEGIAEEVNRTSSEISNTSQEAVTETPNGAKAIQKGKKWAEEHPEQIQAAKTVAKKAGMTALTTVNPAAAKAVKAGQQWAETHPEQVQAAKAAAKTAVRKRAKRP